MTKKVLKKSVKNRKEQTIKSLEAFGGKIYKDLERKNFPSVSIPSRSTSNIHYDEDSKQYVLGDKYSRRSSRNVRHIRPFTHLVWTGFFVHNLCKTNKTSTLRDVFYSAQAFDITFNDQKESDNIITDLESVMEFSREDFNVFPEERSQIFGDLTIEYTVPSYEGKRINLTMHPDGVAVGPALTTAELIGTKANKVIVIEKGAMFTRLIEERAFRKFKAVLIHTAGQPPRATRRLVKRLNTELNLPVYVFCDGDPWGMAIAITVMCGSANAAHLKELTTPEARWMGLYSTDIEKYKLPSTKLENVDVKRLHDMLKDPRCKEEPWHSQIEHFLELKKKCELEAFSRYGLDYVVKKYLPEKLKD